MCATRVLASTLHRKLLRASKIWLLVLVVLELSRDCQGWEPIMMSMSTRSSPAKMEIYIDEGDSLEVACTSAKTMTLYYPKDVANAIKISPASLKEESFSDKQRIKFRRSQTVYGDTGWYGCADPAMDVTPGIYDQPDVNWTYVYVRPNTSYFIQSDVFQSVRNYIGGNATLPCRPTSPRYKVILNANGEEIQMGERASFDPRYGFTLRNIMLADNNFYQCVIQDGNNSQENNFHLVVI